MIRRVRIRFQEQHSTALWRVSAKWTSEHVCSCIQLYSPVCKCYHIACKWLDETNMVAWGNLDVGGCSQATDSSIYWIYIQYWFIFIPFKIQLYWIHIHSILYLLSHIESHGITSIYSIYSLYSLYSGHLGDACCSDECHLSFVAAGGDSVVGLVILHSIHSYNFHIIFSFYSHSFSTSMFQRH